MSKVSGPTATLAMPGGPACAGRTPAIASRPAVPSNPEANSRRVSGAWPVPSRSKLCSVEADPDVTRKPQRRCAGQRRARPALLGPDRLRRVSQSVADDFIIETRGLTKEFQGFVAVSNVDLRVRRGQIHALIGPNGAGKTTVFNLLSKFLIPDRGQILYRGEDITFAKPAAVARRGLVRSFQVSAVFPNLTVLENVRIALQRSLASTFHFWKPASSLSVLNARAMELLEQVDLSACAHTRVAELPYGRKRALEIATTLAMAPELMLLDEPTQGLGHEDVDRVTALIRQAALQRTVLMVEHNMQVVALHRRHASRCSSEASTIAERPLCRGLAQTRRCIEAYMGTAA
jgi:branched-chain amino acid transport system ATP-binding protein